MNLNDITPEMLDRLLELSQGGGPKQFPWSRARTGMVQMVPRTNKVMDRGFLREAPDTGFRSNMPIIEIDPEEQRRRDQERLAPFREQLMADPEMLDRLRMMMDLMRSR
jgi:hypothetical protein